MRKRLFVLGIALGAVMISGGNVAADTLLFNDGFSTDKDSSDIKYQLSERQTGSTTVASYAEKFDTDIYGAAYNMSQIMFWDGWGRNATGKELDLGSGNHWGVENNSFTWASPTANFDVDMYEIVVKMSASCRSGGTNETEAYTGILFGADAQGLRPDVSTTGFGFVLTGNYKQSIAGGEPTWKLYDGAAVVASGYMGGSGPGYYEEIHLLVDNTGTATKLSISNYGVAPMVTDYISQQKLNNNYITLASYNNLAGDSYNWAMFDELSVTDKTPATVPEPSSLVSLLVGALSMGAYASRRRRA